VPFNALWSNLVEGHERELDRWHTIEHMPERLGVPGFLRGRRYMRTKAGDHAMFILYEAAHIDTFRSPGLLARLDDPTEWSKKLQPALTDFLRGPCQTLISLGDGVGGAVAAIRVASEIKDKAGAAQRLMSAAPANNHTPSVPLRPPRTAALPAQAQHARPSHPPCPVHPREAPL